MPPPTSPPVLVVADLHGSYDQAKGLLDYCAHEGLLKDRWVVFLGDYVDIGPDTAKTLDLLIGFQAQHPQTAFCCGNHDLNLAKALGLVQSPDVAFYWSRVPTRNGTTLRSYGAADADDLLAKMPAGHKEFLAELPWCVEHPDYLFVHAGLDPHEPVQSQIEALRARDCSIFKPKWLYDERLAFCTPMDTDQAIVSGHVILKQPVITDRRILLDTGAGYGGPLTAMLLPERAAIQVGGVGIELIGFQSQL